MRGLSRRWILRAVALAAMGSPGCAARSDRMRPAAVSRVPPKSAGAATVVFIRPPDRGGGKLVTVLDDAGRFVGDAVDGSFFAHRADPGDVVFAGCADNTSALRARLAAGKTYYVRVDVRMGAFGTRAHLLALRPRTGAWTELRDWLAECDPLETDPVRAAAWSAENRFDIEDRLVRAKEMLDKYSARELAARTLRPEDGV